MKKLTCRTMSGAVMVLSLVIVPFALPAASAQSWLPGDVFVAVESGSYQVYSNSGVLKQTISDGLPSPGPGVNFTTGCAFNSAGIAPALTRLYTTNFANNTLVVYDNATPHSILTMINTGTTALSNESLVFDAAGNFYVGHPDGNHQIHKYSAGGSLVTTFTAPVENRGTDWIDLAVDQKTLFYASEGRRILRFDVSTASALSDFANFTLTPTGNTASGSTTISSVSSLAGIAVGMAISGTGIPSNTTVASIIPPSTITISQAATATGTGVTLTIITLPGTFFAVRLLPPGDGSGGLLVANRVDIKRLNGAGNVAQTYSVAGESSWFALSLDPNGTSFWAGNFASANFYRFNIFTGAVEAGPINTGTGSNTLFGLCLKTPTISTVASVASGLKSPSAVAVDQGTGDVYIADNGLHQILKVSSGTTTPIAIAGNGTAGFSGDGGPATSAQLNTPFGLAITGSSSTSNLIIYISDFGNQVIRKVSCSATPCTITTYAGTPGMFGFSGDGGLATSAQLYNPKGLAVDASQNLYIADSFNARIRTVSPTTGFITTVAGDGALTIVPSLCGFITTSSGMMVSTCLGDGGLATNATLNGPVDVKVNSAGNLYIADQGNHRIRKVSGGTITTVAGNGSAGSAGDGGPAINAQLRGPSGVALDSTGNLFIADGGNSRLRRVDAVTQNIGTVGGTGQARFNLDNIPASFATLFQPTAVVVDASGNPVAVDFGNQRIRQIKFGPP